MKDNSNKNKIVAVALSGGVDSACAAIDLIEKGYEVFAITMKIFTDQDTSKAKKIAENLHIKYHEIDMIKDFKEKIIDDFINSYMGGFTPNPCLSCNIHMKYGLLLEKAIELGASHMATGHYAKIVYDENDKKYHLIKSANKRKDQTYNLYHLSQNQLAKIIFPLEAYETKDEVRKKAAALIPDLKKEKDSTNICFVGDKSPANFIRQEINYSTIGNFIDAKGNYIDKHKGIFYYTIGQKRNVLANTNKYFVSQIIKESNEIVLTQDEEDLYYDIIHLKDVSYIDAEKIKSEKIKVTVRLCQWGYDLPAEIINRDKSTYVKLIKAARAPSPGQSCVFSQGEEVIGGGIIYKTEKS